jgi:hypothetical protein
MELGNLGAITNNESNSIVQMYNYGADTVNLFSTCNKQVPEILELLYSCHVKK